MKLSFNLLRPIIFFFCGLGYLPLQSADVDMDRETASIAQKKNVETDSNQDTEAHNAQQMN